MQQNLNLMVFKRFILVQDWEDIVFLLDPYYLSWKAREYGFHTSMIESSMMINDRMPEYCAERSMKILNEHGKAMKNSKILLLGYSL